MTTTKPTSEFDRVFEDMSAPEYPATCDGCGEVGTNASMAEHQCLTKEEADLVAGAIPLQALPSGVSLTRSQIGWQSERLPIHGCRVVDNTGRLIAADIYNEEIAEQIVTEHNQHATLIAQQDRLLRLLRPVTSPTACYCAVMKGENCWHCEARELIAAIEEEERQ